MNENAQLVLDYLIENPEKHDQREWVTDSDGEYPRGFAEPNFCGSTMCAAGAAVWLMKGNPFFSQVINSPNFIDVDGEHLDKWTHHGSQALGIDYNVGDALFNTMDKSKALDLLTALANDDLDKFNHLYETVPDEYPAD